MEWVKSHKHWGHSSPSLSVRRKKFQCNDYVIIALRNVGRLSNFSIQNRRKLMIFAIFLHVNFERNFHT